MNQNCANGGKCTWLLKTNITVGLGLRVTGDLERLALCSAEEKLPAAEMSPVELYGGGAEEGGRGAVTWGRGRGLPEGCSTRATLRWAAVERREWGRREGEIVYRHRCVG